MRINADKTEAMFSTKDVKTGEVIHSGEVVYRIFETGGFIKVETYENIVNQPEQEELFTDGTVNSQVHPEVLHKEYKPTENVTDFSNGGDTKQVSMIDELDGQGNLFND